MRITLSLGLTLKRVGSLNVSYLHVAAKDVAEPVALDFSSVPAGAYLVGFWVGLQNPEPGTGYQITLTATDPHGNEYVTAAARTGDGSGQGQASVQEVMYARYGGGGQTFKLNIDFFGTTLRLAYDVTVQAML